ncbi:XisI protein [Aphanothece hegewaldii CCALA 016]|uniref:XisI protein n=1 Tax=Aphanothece hegewaldii CCALA 016 TaxID=2107694 RepID=A0A2T1M3Q2_9CHRO|nr:XisI protein [Aphanothece hegewaldii]PSF39471.1 XisI protein [Aphanothece hegewaldii CCALA 016]
MDTLNKYSEILENILRDYARIPYSYGELERRLLIDHQSHNYALITQGWQLEKRVHGCLIHVEIKNNKIWIQRDGTEDGIVDELMAAGIPKEHIVLAFYSPEIRQHTEFAVN